MNNSFGGEGSIKRMQSMRHIVAEMKPINSHKVLIDMIQILFMHIKASYHFLYL